MTTKRQRKVGNGTRVNVEGIGIVQLMAQKGIEWIKIDLLDVLHIPGSAVNLFSSSAAFNKSLYMLSNKNK